MFWFGFVVGGFVVGMIVFVFGMAIGRICMQNEALEEKLDLYEEVLSESRTVPNWSNN